MSEKRLVLLVRSRCAADVISGDYIIPAAVVELDRVRAIKGVVCFDLAWEPGFASIPLRIDAVADLELWSGLRRGDL